MTLRLRKCFALFALFLLAIPFASGQARAAYSQAELDQMLAPIALYPDPLLSQILMAATRPEEVADAARWAADHRSVEGDVAVQMVQEYDWDPSVKSLVAFPTVLERMGQSPDWTRDLGEAFIAQEPQVMETVQMLRQRAHAAGNLISDERVRIIEEPQAISIVPANPGLVYVPYYDPTVVYGTWWWPAYPPFAWAPWPGYAYYPYYRSAFWWGAPIGLSAGFFFGAIDWPRRHVRIAHTDNYYVRRWFDRRQHLSGTTTTGRWRPDYWQRRDFSRRGTVTQSQTVAPQTVAPSTTTQEQFRGRDTRQFTNRSYQRQFTDPTPPQSYQRQFTDPTPPQSYQRQFTNPTPSPSYQRQFTNPAPGPTMQRQSQPERRGDFERREWRRQEARSAPAPAAAQAAVPARVERAPAPRMEQRAAPPAPRMQAAPPPARADRAERADRGPPAHANGQGRSR